MTAVSRVRDLLAEAEADLWVALASSAAEPDIAPFVGDVHLGQSFLVVARKGDPRLGYFTDMERDEALRTGLPLAGPKELDLEALRGLDLSPGAFLGDSVARAAATVGIEGGTILLAGTAPAGDVLDLHTRLAEAGWTLRSGAELGRLVRKSKSGSAHDEIRRVSGFLCDAFRAVASLLARADAKGGELRADDEPITAGRIRALVGRVFAEGGLDQPHGNIVAMGSDAGVPHTSGADDRALRAGESLIVDLYPKGHLYSDCTRTFCLGEPSEALERAHTLVLETLREAHASARAGVDGWDLQRATCDRFERAGYPTPIDAPGSLHGYVHNLGHGVGFELHEYPSFRKGAAAAGVLEVGDVFTLEPGLYDPNPTGGYGVRLEDTVICTPSGLENLTPLPYELDPKVWV